MVDPKAPEQADGLEPFLEDDIGNEESDRMYPKRTVMVKSCITRSTFAGTARDESHLFGMWMKTLDATGEFQGRTNVTIHDQSDGSPQIANRT